MSARLRVSFSLLGAFALGGPALPSPAAAEILFPSGYAQEQPYPRPGYRQTLNDFPPPQHGLFGQPIEPSGIEPRPTYRQNFNAFPPAGGRYGGGIIEYFKTDGRPEPVAPQYAAPGLVGPAYAAPGYGYGAPGYGAAPAYAATAYGAGGQRYAPSPRRAALPKGGLPEYVPDTLASYGARGPARHAASQPRAAGYQAQAAGYGGYPNQTAGYGYQVQPAYAAPPPAYAAQQSAFELPQLQLPFLLQPALAPPTAAYTAPVGVPAGRDPYDPVAADPGLVSRPMDPAYNRQMVAYGGSARPGTIIIDTPHKYLYLIQPGSQAIRYGIGVGRPGFTWRGNKRISRKAEWPDWTPPKEMLARRPDLPRHMEGGEANPLGARALYLGSSLYRIHGTNEPYTIGTNVSSGCIRMMNQDVIDLYNRVGVGTPVLVM